MGKKAKEHRKKVAARNQQIKAAQNAYQKMMNEQMQKYLADLREKALKQQEQEGDVQNSGTTGFSGIQG
jgi:DNA-binding FrmR family transcriptional regulator